MVMRQLLVFHYQNAVDQETDGKNTLLFPLP